MDAGVRLDPGEILPLVYDDSAPLTFDPNGQFHMQLGGSSLGGEGDGGNSQSYCRKDPCDDETSAPQETRVATQQQHAAQSYTNLPVVSPPKLSVSSFTITLGSTWVSQSSMGAAVITGLPLSSSTPVSSLLVSPPVSTSSTISADSSTPIHGSTLSSVSSLSISSPSTSLLASLSFHQSASSVTRSFGVPLSSSSPACRSSPICHTGLPESSRSMSRAILSTLLASSTSVARYQKTIIPAIPAKVSTLDTHTRSWYLGVIFGTIAGIALLVFFISLAFCRCRRAIKRRRAQNTHVPWAPKAGDEEERGGSRNLSSNSNASTSLENSPCVQRWLPAGDRGVGESRGAPGYTSTNPNDSTYSLHNHPIPGHGLFSDEPLPTGSGRKPLVGHHLYPSTTLRQLPSHLIDDEIAARALQEDRSSYSPFGGSPVRPWQRSRSRGARDIENTTYNPYIDPSSESIQDRNQASHFSDQQTSGTVGRRPLVDRLRNLGKQKGEYSGSWDRLPTPGKDQAKEDVEPWAVSFKANLVNAFHAFAASISSSPSEPLSSREVALDHHDGLTRAPTRRRMSSRDGLMKPLSRQTSDKRNIRSSKPWILHEREDGSGTVHFLPGLEKYDHGETERRSPGKLTPFLSFGTGENFSTYDDEQMGHHPRRTAEPPRRSHIPLTILSSPPAKAIIKPDIETAENNSRSGDYSSLGKKWTPISRDSSVYSSSTLTSSTSTTKFGSVSRLPRISEFGSTPRL